MGPRVNLAAEDAADKVTSTQAGEVEVPATQGTQRSRAGARGGAWGGTRGGTRGGSRGGSRAAQGRGGRAATQAYGQGSQY